MPDNNEEDSFMKKSYFLTQSIMGILLIFFMLNGFAASPSPVGDWQTVDDVTKQPRGIIRIKEKDGMLAGYIIKIDYRPGEGPEDVCKKCTDFRKNQKILGMNVLWHMVALADNTWGNGNILDPENGKVYQCKMKLSDDANTLQVRGYIGIPLLGRTQIWTRIE